MDYKMVGLLYYPSKCERQSWQVGTLDVPINMHTTFLLSAEESKCNKCRIRVNHIITPSISLSSPHTLYLNNINPSFPHSTTTLLTMSERAAASRHRRRPSQGIFMLPDDLSAPPPSENSGGNIIVPPPGQAPRHGGAPPQPPQVKSSEEMSKGPESKKGSDEGSKNS